MNRENLPSHRTGFRWYWLLLLWMMAATIIASHRPSSLLHAQFWAEDGRIWYAQAYQQGQWLPLTHIQDGYYQTFPRLVADLAVLFPFHLAPLVMNCAALLVQGLPVAFLFTSRAAGWGSLRIRALMALLYVTLPNSGEWHANTTNTQWILALLAIMTLLARLPRGWVGRLSDLSILSLCGVTGPFCILLAPVACVMAWYRRERWRTIYAVMLLSFSALQGYAIFITRHAMRMHQPLGASIPLLTRILAVRIFAGAVIGTFSPLSSLRVPLILPMMIVIPSLLLMIAGLWRAPLELKLFTLFGAEVLVAALRTPMVTHIGPQWLAILNLADARYYLFPMLAFLFCVGHIVTTRQVLWLRIVAGVLLCMVSVGIVHNWRDYGNWRDFARYDDFPAISRRFEASPPGTSMTIRIEPAQLWTMTIVRR